MKKIRNFCDEIEDLLIGNEIFQARTRGVGVIPARGRPAVRPVRRQPARQRRRLGPAPRPGPADGVGQGRLEGLDPPRRRQLRPLLGPPAGDARVDEDRRPAARRLPAGPIMAKVPRIIKVPEGEAWVSHREPARRDGLLHRQPGRPRPVPGQDPLGQLQQHLDRPVGAARRVRARHHHDPRLASTSSSGTSTGDASRSTDPVLGAVAAPRARRHRRRAAAGRHDRLPLPVQDDDRSCRAGSGRWRPGRTARCSCSPRSASGCRRRTPRRQRPTTRIFKMAPLIVLVSTFLLVAVVPFGPDAWLHQLRGRRLLRPRRVSRSACSASSSPAGPAPTSTRCSAACAPPAS